MTGTFEATTEWVFVSASNGYRRLRLAFNASINQAAGTATITAGSIWHEQSGGNLSQSVAVGPTNITIGGRHIFSLPRMADPWTNPIVQSGGWTNMAANSHWGTEAHRTFWYDGNGNLSLHIIMDTAIWVTTVTQGAIQETWTLPQWWGSIGNPVITGFASSNGFSPVAGTDVWTSRNSTISTFWRESPGINNSIIRRNVQYFTYRPGLGFILLHTWNFAPQERADSLIAPWVGPGEVISFNVQTFSQHGNQVTNAWTPWIHINHPPNPARLIHPIDQATVYLNDWAVVDALSGDLGGFSPERNSLDFNLLFNGVPIGWRFPETVFFPGVGFFPGAVFFPGYHTQAGRTATLTPQAGDGWELGQGSTITISCGSFIISQPLRSNTGASLTPHTWLTLPAVTIDGHPSQVWETTAVDVRFGDGPWHTLVDSIITRYWHEDEIDNDSIFFRLVRQFGHEKFRQNQVLSFRSWHSIGHLQVHSAPIDMFYNVPQIGSWFFRTDGWENHAFWYPMDNTIPFAEVYYSIYTHLSQWNFDFPGTINYELRVPGGDWWRISSHQIVQDRLYQSRVDHVWQEGLYPGAVYEMRIVVELLHFGAIAETNTVWVDLPWGQQQLPQDRFRIERRTPPRVYPFHWGTPRLDFIRNDSNDNMIAIPYQIHWNFNRAFWLEVAEIQVTGRQTGAFAVSADMDGRVLFSPTLQPMINDTAFMQVENAIYPNIPNMGGASVGRHGWAMLAGRAIDHMHDVTFWGTPGGTWGGVAANEEQDVQLILAAREAFRVNLNDTVPSFDAHTSARSWDTLNWVSNTFAPPQFNPGSITMTRTLT